MMRGQSINLAASGGRSIEAHLHVPGSGGGPGLILLQDAADNDRDLSELGDLYAEEGYAVLRPKGFGIAQGTEDLAAAVAALRSRPECTGKVGALGFGLGGKLAYLAAAEAGVDCAISYYGSTPNSGSISSHASAVRWPSIWPGTIRRSRPVPRRGCNKA